MSVSPDIQKKALQLLLSTFKQKAKQKLQSSRRGIWTGKLLDSITGSVEYDDGEWNIFIDMEHYGEFLDEGVNGTEKNWGSRFGYTSKKPPISALTPWANAKGLSPWAVQQSIYKNGIKPIHFFSDVFDSEMDKMLDYIIEAEIDDKLNNDFFPDL
ncbi:hypothetical protein ABGT15_04275 [Flavobacterium enshiense]|uniref:hypothetical protein n=1 Tax=Flavobacterium enshiense TaxID=1341165 RepID=UPI00345D7104